MISTCIHCKSEFQWEYDKDTVGLCIVVCCHCKQHNWIQGDGHIKPILTSKPLQVAKKWVVRKNDEQWLSGGLMAYRLSDAKLFDSFVEAANAAVTWIIKYGDKPDNKGCKITIEELS